VQELFEQNATLRGTVMVGMVDADTNDVPPPYGTGGVKPTLAVYQAGNKGWPRYISVGHDARHSIHSTAFDPLAFRSEQGKVQ